jgi:hypothetical protein
MHACKCAPGHAWRTMHTGKNNVRVYFCTQLLSHLPLTIEHVENTEKNGTRYFSGQYIDLTRRVGSPPHGGFEGVPPPPQCTPVARGLTKSLTLHISVSTHGGIITSMIHCI